MRRVKTVDEIYREVSGCTLVITNDAALATALNLRIERPLIGPFAVTPHQISGMYESEILGVPVMNDIRLISAISADTGIDFRKVHGEVKNIREIREYTSDVRKHLTTKSARKVFDSMQTYPVRERAMSAFDPENCPLYRSNQGKIAVVGVDFFNDLDKYFIPMDFLDVDIFAEGEYEIPEIMEVGNDRQIAENVADLIDQENCDDCAIVLDTSSPVSDSVRSALYRKKIPFFNRLDVRDLSQIRDYLSFVTLALSYEALRVKHVRELFANYNGFFSPGSDGFLLSRQDPEKMKYRCSELRDIMENIRSMTFDEVRERLCDKRARIQVGIVITDLGIAGRKITSELVSQLNYAVDNISDLRHNEEIPPDEKRGVLIADCKRSVYVDRPLVFFLNMDHDWDINTAGKRYIDSEAETEKNAMKITAMLQQGERRVYVVNSSKNGKKARPALIFDTVFGRSVSGFRDICGKIVPGRWYNPEPEARYSRGEDRLGSAEEIIEGFSKTGFNAYFSCPRMFFFYKILRTPEEKDAEFGSLIHEFAQFYICYPEIVRSEGIGKLIDAVSDRYSGLSTPLMKDLDRDRIACAMKNVTRYIDSRIKAEVPLDRVPDPEHENRFFKMYGLERGSSVCESPCVSRTRILYGIFDAVTDTAVLDYKTGKARSAKHICDSMSLSRPARYPEFQPVIYSALANEGAGHRDLELFYALDNDAESVSGDYDIERSVRTVRIVDGDINSVIRENEILRMKLEKTLSIKFKENIPGFLKTISECDLDPDPAFWDNNSEVIAAVLRFSGLKDGKTNREAVRRAVRKVAKAVSGGMIYDDRRINILTENIDDFYRAAEEMHRDALKYALSEFPAEPRIRCRDCRFFSSCTAEISDSGDTEEEP